MNPTLLDILARRAHEDPDRLGYRWLRDGTSDDAVDWTYGELGRQVAAMAASLRERGVAPGQRVVLAVDPGLAYVAALFGILATGATAVPAFPPDGRRSLARFQAIVLDCRPDLVLASSRFAEHADARWWLLDELAAPDASAPPLTAGAGTDPALLQYTSGSTGDPKGIVLTHENLVSNCRVLQCHTGVEPDRVGCSWLPPYHDMGLMGTIMFSLYGGWPLVMLSPLHFIQQPFRWLKAITDHAATITVGPNFAFDLCAEHVTEDEREQVDLSTLRQVFCGSETVHRGTLDRFQQRFGPARLRRALADPVLRPRRGDPVRLRPAVGHPGQDRRGRHRRAGRRRGAAAGGGRGRRQPRRELRARRRRPRGGDRRRGGRRGRSRPGRRDLRAGAERRRGLPRPAGREPRGLPRRARGRGGDVPEDRRPRVPARR
jgi:acyl-CoA synthetase (AMP-forming)/AMP-acid ligase II